MAGEHAPFSISKTLVRFQGDFSSSAFWSWAARNIMVRYEHGITKRGVDEYIRLSHRANVFTLWMGRVASYSSLRQVLS